jgi:hypothetical protein
MRINTVNGQRIHLVGLNDLIMSMVNNFFPPLIISELLKILEQLCAEADLVNKEVRNTRQVIYSC